MAELFVNRIVAVCAALLIAATAFAQPTELAGPAPVLPYRVVAQYPHDVTAFTEGLLIHDGSLIESTGLYGHSGLFIRDIRTGRTRQSIHLQDADFGEGVSLVGSHIYQLTWREGICRVFDLTLHEIAEYRYAGEGWGLAFNGTELIRSDGTATLHFHDPVDFHERRSMMVRDAGRPVPLLNELEVANGQLYSNVWMSDRIAVIDLATGTVTGWLDLEDLKTLFVPPDGWDPRDDVLNGIAYDPGSGHLLVTGKRWPVLFEISVGSIGQASTR